MDYMKFALVTGASRGIGRAVCIRMAKAGYNILLNYKSNDAAANETKLAIEALGVSVHLLKFDVGNKEETDAVLGNWIETNKENRIEVLVNNAGIRQDALLMWMTQEQWRNVLGSSLDAFYYVTRLVVSGMLAKRFGRIINIVSLSGIKGMPGQTNYSAAKAGIIGATKALAQEVARRGVTVNAVAPGFIKTDMTADLNEADLAKLVPMQRFGTPEEVAHAVAFFASPEASYITGDVMHINGGLYS